jgi:isoleucyl-tRNA synthetase
MPDWGESRIDGMVRNRPDWCISRQRTWGVPIALLVHKDTGALHPRTAELIEAVAERIEQKGIDAWFELRPADLLGEAEGADYEKVHDTLDVWFDSGVTHACVLEHRDGLHVPAPTSIWKAPISTAAGSSRRCSRRWPCTARTLQAGADPRLHGGPAGRKMSKSLGNVVKPQDVMKTLGADIIRLWVAATDYRGEMAVSDEILKRTADAYRRIRNTARFLLSNLNGFDPARMWSRPRT